MTNSHRSIYLSLMLVLVVLCLLQAPTDAEARGRVRGEKNGKAVDSSNNNNSNSRRRLFADKLRDPDNPGRGGAGGAAKGFQEFVSMMTAVTPAPAPTMQTRPPTNPPVARPTSPPVPATTPAPVPPINDPNRNDRCARAKGPIEVTPEGFGNSRAIIYTDTTVNARVPVVSPDRCNGITNSAPGVWYDVVGTGDRMTASLCWPGTSFDSKITIYRGDCNSVLTCVNANDDASGNFGACAINRQASRVQWESTQGTVYHLLIHGFGTRTGDFQLNVFNQRPLNNRCEDAKDISVGDTLLGTTFQATFPFDGQAANCGGRFGLIGEANSVWYRSIGTGRTVTATTCSDVTDFDTKIHVFEGDCGINDCIGGNDNFQSPGRCSQHSWQTQSGEEYYIMVHGFLTANGLFEFSLR